MAQSSSLGILVRLLLLGVLAGAGYHYYREGVFDRWLPEPYQSSAPTDPVSAPATSPNERRLPLASELHKIDRRFWPVQVQLKKPVDFPVVKNGEQVGTVRGNPGNMVKVLFLKDEKLMVENSAKLRAEVPVGDTDMIERVYELMRASDGTTTRARPNHYLLPATELGRQLSEKEKL